MHAIISEIIAIKAKAEGVTEYEIYRRYLKNKDTNRLLLPPDEEMVEGVKEEPI